MAARFDVPFNIPQPRLAGSSGRITIILVVYFFWFMALVCWWTLLGSYWMLRGLFYDGPRWGWRQWQARGVRA